MKKQLVLLLMVSFLNYFKVTATGQQPDILIYRDTTMNLCCLPLVQYQDSESLDPKKLFKSYQSSTSNWRGSVSTWAIYDGHLYLIRLENESKTEQVDLAKMFGDKYRDGKVLADWFTGPLYCGIGKVIFYVHDGFNYSFEKELEISIQNGAYVSEKINDNTKSRQVDYELLFSSSYARPNGFKEHIDSLINWKDLPPIPERELRTVIRFSANEDGVIDDIKVMRGCGVIFDNEAIRIVRTLPANVQFYHGKLVRCYYTLPIVFKESTRLSNLSKK